MKRNPFYDKILFISRQLGVGSIFQQLKSKGWTIIDRSLLNLEYLLTNEIPVSEWIFFYSPNGVKAFAQNANKLNFNLKSVKLAAYGPGTADVIQSFHWKVDFIGTGDATGTLHNFNLVASGSRVLFPMATNSKHALLLSGKYNFVPIDLFVYENLMNPLEVQACDIYIFTSSLNVHSFFISNYIADGAQVIAIGKPTATTLSEYYTGEIKIPSAPTEKELFMLIDYNN